MKILYIMGFGFVGGVLRFSCGDSLTSILILNAAGAIALAMISSFAVHRTVWLETGIGVGFIGSLTTFSSLMFVTVDAYSQHSIEVLASMGITVGSIALCGLAMALTRRTKGRAELNDEPRDNQQNTRNQSRMPAHPSAPMGDDMQRV
ncbi:fluoride efflux transporter FluC [Alicyclobacillus acidoterrestris]|uniref:Fluoride-specific ion channel n=1 Tax=Alicyclobacillus acidoterrestris (strain ATCC 49025 / DSM 3922 / CIP 106132 / NCIMB 13137 / GD3B) TaxID=1356854 RepID=T0BM73_ALIAG|nr:CrcB family protein [Alicyclobacillus acidoterrestris]EPZ45088.1 hypothetical protein N007_09775 [Alicyclobacillus acidoterrestris ATCC 49025]UNO48376.1 CrcB family protein [Alicyclobacillus acidoterrestris]